MHRAMNAALGLGVLSALMLIATAAQPLGPPDGMGGRLVGRVTDWNGDGLVGVVVVANGENAGRPMRTTTESSGGFQFATLPPGRYEIVAETANHRLERATVQVKEGGRSTLVLRLHRN